MKKKNILIIGNYPPPYGGVPHHIELLSGYLATKGWSCHVLSGGTSGNETMGAITVYKPTYLRKLIGILRQIFDRTFEKWLAEGTLNRKQPKFWMRYKMYADVGAQIIRDNNIDLIASYNLLTYAPVGAWLSRKYRIPHVVSVFGEIYKFNSLQQNSSFFAQVASTASRLLSCSDHCGMSVQRIGVDAPVHTVTYGVNIEHFTPGDEPIEMRSSLGIGSGPVVLFVGRLGREMGLDSFLAAARLLEERVTNIHFVMVGQAGDLAEEVQEACELSSGRYVLRCNAPYPELPNYYRLADIVVVPTRGDRTCSSLAGMEAMATRKPVIGFSIGGIPEIIENEKTGLLVEPENISALADGIVRILFDDVFRKKISEAGYRQAQKRFDERLVNIEMERYFLNALSSL